MRPREALQSLKNIRRRRSLRNLSTRKSAGFSRCAGFSDRFVFNRVEIDARGRKKNSFLRKRILRYYASSSSRSSCARFFEVLIEGGSKLCLNYLQARVAGMSSFVPLLRYRVVSAKLNFKVPQRFSSFITFIIIIIYQKKYR